MEGISALRLLFLPRTSRWGKDPHLRDFVSYLLWCRWGRNADRNLSHSLYFSFFPLLYCPWRVSKVISTLHTNQSKSLSAFMLLLHTPILHFTRNAKQQNPPWTKETWRTLVGSSGQKVGWECAGLSFSAQTWLTLVESLRQEMGSAFLLPSSFGLPACKVVVRPYEVVKTQWFIICMISFLFLSHCDRVINCSFKFLPLKNSCHVVNLKAFRSRIL